LACLTTFAARKNSWTAGMDCGGWVGLPAAGPGLFFLVTMSSVGGVQISTHGGLRCQEGVLVCPGDLEIAGSAVVLAFFAAAVFRAVARSGVKLERPQR
jgi:hypothetical protein